MLTTTNCDRCFEGHAIKVYATGRGLCALCLEDVANEDRAADARVERMVTETNGTPAAWGLTD
jgi:hypothetical protein